MRAALIALLLASSGAIGQVPQPAAVPPHLGGTGLPAQRSALVDQGRDLEREIRDQQGQCSKVDSEDSARVQSCTEWRGRLVAQYRQYSERLKSFEKDIDIHERLAERRDELAHLKKMVGVWQKSLRDLQKTQNLQQALADAASESEAAQLEALTAATSYLMGPLGDAVKQAARDGTLAWQNYQRVKPALQTARQALVKYRRVWSKYQVLRPEVERLEAELALAETVLKGADDVRELGGIVHRLGDGTLKVLKVVKVVSDTREKQELMAAMAELQKGSFELLKSSSLDLAISQAEGRGMELVGQRARIAKFVAGYSAAAAKFGLAWAQINELLAAVDDRNRLALTFELNLHRTESRRQEVAAEIRELEAALGAPLAAKEETLRIFRARELQAAHRGGDWFSNTTGVRAPGEPIFAK